MNVTVPGVEGPHDAVAPSDENRAVVASTTTVTSSTYCSAQHESHVERSAGLEHTWLLKASVPTHAPCSACGRERVTLPRIGWLMTTLVPLLLKTVHAAVAAGVIGDTSGGHACITCCCAAAPAAKTSMAA